MAVLSETITIPIWTVAAAAAALILGAALIGRRAATWRVAAVGACVLAAALLVVALPMPQPSGSRTGQGEAAAGRSNDPAPERRSLDERRAELAARAAVSGSSLVCLDGLAGEPVETACEPAVFASPLSVAHAVSYAAARLQLLADGLAYARRADAGYEASLADLRRAVENDAFGIYAHVLAARDGCTPERCAAFALVRDPSTLKIHLRQRRYATYVAEHRDRWGGTARPTAAAVPVAAIAAAAQFSPIAAAAAPLPVLPETAPLPAPDVAPPVVTAPAEPPPPLPKARPTTLASRTDADVSGDAAAPPASMALAAPAAPEERPAATDARAPRRGLVPPAQSVLPNISYPSAASIPAISIIAAEPKLPSAEATAAAPSTAPRRIAPPQ